ncbi:MAG: hypothetical protein IT373_22045 [Polyangiaceae bacterium]|nr:hypothetical protein [Polyangiaceae bacterium]
MGRPRVIVATEDPSLAVDMMAAFDPKRYRVEHVFDSTEALLRAEVVLAHVVVLQVSELDEDLAKRCARRSHRVSLVLVSERPEVLGAADQLGARAVALPFSAVDLRTTVFESIAQAKGSRPHLKATPDRRRVLILAETAEHASVVGAVLEKDLGVECLTATDLTQAALALRGRPACVVADAALLVDGELGPAFVRYLEEFRVALVHLPPSQGVDVSEAGQAAWDVIPQLRRALQETEGNGSSGGAKQAS